MSRKRKRRGVSLGTVVMLVLTILVLAGAAEVFTKLMGDTVVDIDTSIVLEAMSLSEGLPELSLSDIPISVSTANPTATAATGSLVLASTAVPATQPQATAKPAVTAAPTTVPFTGGTVTLTLGGSINMDEAIRKSGYYSDSKKYDFSDILSLIDDEMQSDLTMVSFENLVMPDKNVSELIAPVEAVQMLNAAGVDIVALGFPQAYDQAAEGLSSTVKAVTDLGMSALGAYVSAEDSVSGRVFNVNGVSVGFLHYTQTLSSKSDKAIKKDEAAYSVPVAEAEAIAKDIAALRGRGVHVVIVSVNWEGSKSTPTKAQTQLCQQIADVGADVIVGTGTGIVQPAVWLERSGGSSGKTLCAYSLGSLLNESRKNAGVASILLQLKISVDNAGRVAFDEAAYTPTYIWRYKQDSKYYYRVVASDQPAPDGMGDDQTEPKNRALTNVQSYLGEDSVLTLRTR